ncbi:MAG: universal stress protein [Bacteroidales bacterium]|nr:universal stress protein [Bacteroidales bacterium]
MKNCATQTILVPLDFTDVAEYALDHAKALAGIFGYQLFLLHVVQKKHKGKAQEAEAAKRLRELAGQLKENTGLEVDHTVRAGNIFDTISDLADELSAVFIVMGVHGKKGVAHLVGSYPYKVVCRAHVPVLVVKEKHHHVGFDNIVVPIDFSRRSAQKVAQATKFARFFGAKIRVFGFLSHDNKAKIINKEALLKSVTDFFISKGVSVTTDLLVKPGMDWDEALLMFADKVKADLIMIVAERGSRFQDIFSSNYTERILDKVNVPVLTIMPCAEDLAEEAEAVSSRQGIVTPFVDPLGFFARSADII